MTNPSWSGKTLALPSTARETDEEGNREEASMPMRFLKTLTTILPLALLAPGLPVVAAADDDSTSATVSSSKQQAL